MVGFYLLFFCLFELFDDVFFFLDEFVFPLDFFLGRFEEGVDVVGEYLQFVFESADSAEVDFAREAFM